MALAAWFLFSAWAFAGSAYSDYLLAVASGLIVTTIALPAAVWRNWRHHPHEKEEPSGSFREWTTMTEFRTWQDRVKGKNAAIEILLPVAAVASGRSIFAIILHFIPR